MRRSRRLVLRAATGLVLLGVPAAASATTRFYVGPSGGAWLTSSNWNPVGAPAPGDTAVLNNGIAGSYTVNFGAGNYNAATPINQLFVSSQSGGAVNFVQNVVGSSMAAIEEHIGADTGTGVYNQSAGLNTVTSDGTQAGLRLGENFNTGIYNLSGGTLSVASGNEQLGSGGKGTFNQTGGFNGASRVSLAVQGTGSQVGTGTYLISAGTLSAVDILDVGAQGTGFFESCCAFA